MYEKNYQCLKLTISTNVIKSKNLKCKINVQSSIIIITKDYIQLKCWWFMLIQLLKIINN